MRFTSNLKRLALTSSSGMIRRQTLSISIRNFIGTRSLRISRTPSIISILHRADVNGLRASTVTSFAPNVSCAFPDHSTSLGRESHRRRVLASYVYYDQARTWRWATMRPWAGRSSGPVSLSPSQSCPGCTINTSGSNFRKGQAARGRPAAPDRSGALRKPQRNIVYTRPISSLRCGLLEHASDTRLDLQRASTSDKAGAEPKCKLRELPSRTGTKGNLVCTPANVAMQRILMLDTASTQQSRLHPFLNRTLGSSVTSIGMDA